MYAADKRRFRLASLVVSLFGIVVAVTLIVVALSVWMRHMQSCPRGYILYKEEGNLCCPKGHFAALGECFKYTTTYGSFD